MPPLVTSYPQELIYRNGLVDILPCHLDFFKILFYRDIVLNVQLILKLSIHYSNTDFNPFASICLQVYKNSCTRCVYLRFRKIKHLSIEEYIYTYIREELKQYLSIPISLQCFIFCIVKFYIFF